VRGAVLGGYDWQILHSDRYAELDARYNLRTDDGHLIYVRASGRRYASPEALQKLLRGEPVSRGPDYYGASTPLIETGAPELMDELSRLHRQFAQRARCAESAFFRRRLRRSAGMNSAKRGKKMRR
jgi:hypothetical protein